MLLRSIFVASNRALRLSSTCNNRFRSSSFRRTLSLTRRMHSIFSAPSSSTTCWNCNQEITREQLFCDKKCESLQAIKPGDINYFALFGIPVSLVVDKRLLESRFKDLQKKLHPDLYTNKCARERIASAETSSTVNQAYQTIRNPQLRMNYVLAQFGIKVLGEDGGTYHNPELMSEMFEFRSKIEEAEGKADLLALMQSTSTVVDECLKQLDRYVQEKNTSKMMPVAVRLQYMYKASDEINSALDVIAGNMNHIGTNCTSTKINNS